MTATGRLRSVESMIEATELTKGYGEKTAVDRLKTAVERLKTAVERLSTPSAGSRASHRPAAPAKRKRPTGASADAADGLRPWPSPGLAARYAAVLLLDAAVAQNRRDV
ncbi:hypothetical protein SALBM135S_08547 [Streptomyces alboniger]